MAAVRGRIDRPFFIFRSHSTPEYHNVDPSSTSANPSRVSQQTQSSTRKNHSGTSIYQRSEFQFQFSNFHIAHQSSAILCLARAYLVCAFVHHFYREPPRSLRWSRSNPQFHIQLGYPSAPCRLVAHHFFPLITFFPIFFCALVWLSKIQKRNKKTISTTFIPLRASQTVLIDFIFFFMTRIHTITFLPCAH